MNDGYMDKAILVDRKPVLTADTRAWARWYETAERRVAETVINRRKRIRVSTVFLGMDHGFRERQWFETMVFGSSIHEAQARYGTWEQAERGHARMVRRARQARQTCYRDFNYKRARRRLRRTFQRIKSLLP